MKRKTTEQFIKSAKEIHKNTYIYDDTVYINARTKVKIFCKIHGTFYQYPHIHLNGSKCNSCSKTKTTEQYIKDSKKVHGDKYTYDKLIYINHKIKVEITCPEHGDFFQNPCAHLNGQGCAKCATTIRSNNKRKSFEEFLEEAIKVHGDAYNYDKVIYKSNKKNIIITCNMHGDFEQQPKNHLNGQGCVKCTERGFKATQPARLYIHKDIYETAYKAGITGQDLEERLKQLNRSFFKEFSIENFWNNEISILFEKGSLALELETIIHKMTNCGKNFNGFYNKGSGCTETYSTEYNDIVLSVVKEFLSTYKNEYIIENDIHGKLNIFDVI